MTPSQLWKRISRFFVKRKQDDPEQDARTTPIGLFHYAHSYAASASAVQQANVKATHAYAPLNFLYSHAIELYLKSFLRLKGMNISELRSRKFGHNTTKLVNRAIGLGLQVSDVQKQQIVMTGDAIHDRYIETGGRTILKPESLHEVCLHLHNQIGPAVYEERGLKRSPPGLS